MCSSAPARKGKESDKHPEGGVSGEDGLPDTSQQTTDSHVLCEYCRKIEFDPERKFNFRSWNLGTISRIKQSQCRFCKLLELACIPGNSPEGEAESATITIYWAVEAGRGGRRALATRIETRESFIETNAICLAAIPNLNPDHVDSPRPGCYLRLARSANIDLKFITDCLSKCSAQHGLECNPSYSDPAFPRLNFLRVIDVNRCCVVEAPLDSRYVALSYVWGGTPCYKLTTTNETSLSQDGALERMVDDLTLPRTISDAMALVRGLGAQYLWVDALCLIQDNTKDLAAGIAVMDDIYERSWFTIIAAGGKDASFGLPGVQSGSRSAAKLSHEIMPGLHLGIDITLESSLKHSVYSTRAWTLQEQLLSRRALFFADDRVVFRCRQTEHSEDHADAFGSALIANGELSLPEAINMIDPMYDY
ncbi:heterokaryon incompatibility protein [Cladorrhinum sp. PSN259]|nr:heterokaryon incompatibility protein [Cladorrhinum sp. PSN259]